MVSEREKIPPELREDTFHKFGGCCAYCGVELKLNRFQVDHVIPIAAGGPNDICNYFPACKECNAFKNAYPLETFRKSLETHPFTKYSFVLAERFGYIKILTPKPVVFYFETLGYKFDEELVLALIKTQI